MDKDKVVLVVDDAPANIHAVNEILRGAYRVRVATSGARALELAAGAPQPDLILLDIVMPEMDGYEVCRRLKANPATQDIPVIFVTGQTESADETRGFECGAVDYIHKPFSPAVVAARVQTHLALREARQLLSRQLRDLRIELDTARLIQQSILPEELPRIANLDLAAHYLPMSAVAGDFYDFLPVDDHRVGILVADVSGHGMPAALIASMLKIALPAQAGLASEPARVLAGLNRSLCGKFQGHYVTAAYAFIDTEKRTLRYGGAGHPPLFLRDGASGETRAIMENGVFLGFFPDATYTEIELPFREGDCLVLYTDGVSEAANPADEPFGDSRLAAHIQQNGDGSSAVLARGLIEAVSAWSGQAEQSDDVTLLVSHFRAAAAPELATAAHSQSTSFL